MENKRVFNKFENANAILNGMDDCCDEFVECFVKLHQQPIDNFYMYEWFLRSLIDVIKINHSVLYVACGTAGYARLFKNIRRFVGIDFSKKMIAAAKQLNPKKEIDFEFYCTTLESFATNELFDIIYMGPYGHNVPYTTLALEKAKKHLKNDGMIFCTIGDPEFKNFWYRIKSFIKNFIINRNFCYDPIKNLENLLKKSYLTINIKLKIKTSLGHALCYIVQKNQI